MKYCFFLLCFERLGDSSLIVGLSIRHLNHVGIKEVSEEVLHPAALRAPSGRDQRRSQSQVEAPAGFQGCGARLCRVQALHGAGQPDEPLEALDVSAAVVHQLVFRHGAAAAGGGNKNKVCVCVFSPTA